MKPPRKLAFPFPDVVAITFVPDLLAPGNHLDVPDLTGSADKSSNIHSSRIIGPILHWLFPHISEDTTNTIVHVIRKCAHLTEYAILSLLLWRAIRKPIRRDSRPWDWRIAGLAVLGVMLYASTDEIHQAFVPSRTANVSDVLIDTIGGAVGILALWLLGYWRRSRNSEVPHRSVIFK